MILLELEIQDYKQFAGTHRFTPSQEGVIAIIGQNGAGKTTLFEAIEWCLYQPREIGADEVPPRGLPGKPRVRVTLLDPHSGVQYVIERSLAKSKTAKAEIYRADEPEKRIVEGSRQVSDYVARTLIGLGHRAFVSTFFTRQKELTFFGNLKETDRRREVGRLLGMETIREAQKLIAEERAEFVQQARVLRRQFDEESQGRDFAAELQAAEERVESTSASLATAVSLLERAEAAHVATRIEAERLTGVERQDAALRQMVAKIEGDVRAAESRRDGALAELARMEQSAAERALLAEQAAGLDGARVLLQSHELDRERHLSLQRLRSERERTNAVLQETTAALRQAVVDAAATRVSGWRWTEADDRSPVDGATRLEQVAAAVDIDVIAARVAALERADTFANDVAQAEAQISNFKAFLEKLLADRDEMLRAGDPSVRRVEVGAERERWLHLVASGDARQRAIASERATLEPVLGRLRAQEDGATCPTCGRPIVASDIAVTVSVFEERLARYTDEERTLRADRDRAKQRAEDLEREATSLEKRATEIATLNGRIETGGQRIAETESGLVKVRESLQAHLAANGWNATPAPEVLVSAREELEITRRVASSRQLVARLGAAAARAISEEQEVAQELGQLGEVTYDPGAHAEARERVRLAEAAQARMMQIDSILAQRPDRERDVAEAIAAIESATRVRVEREAERRMLAFDPVSLEAARAAESAAVLAERQARDGRAAAQAAHADAVRAKDAVAADQARIQGLAERSDRRGREADELDRMYREFNAFEQYVADRLTPQLADYTAELLNAITEGKYDRVQFTNNYGIEVFDGLDEHFPVEEFSGGERDVIALCARLALSRLIGGQAANPPGFMVLDEVFGSLDRERRAQTLDTFGALAGSAEAFSQLFIISHVDDVRSSPIFNEVWRISEGPDGVSHLENLNVTGGFEDA